MLHLRRSATLTLLVLCCAAPLLAQTPSFTSFDPRSIELQGDPLAQAHAVAPIQFDHDGILDAYARIERELYLALAVGHWDASMRLEREQGAVDVGDAVHLVGAAQGRDALVTAGSDGLIAWLANDVNPRLPFELALQPAGGASWNEATRVLAGPAPLVFGETLWSQLAVWDATSNVLHSYLVAHDLQPKTPALVVEVGSIELDLVPGHLALVDHSSAPLHEFAVVDAAGIHVLPATGGDSLRDVLPVGPTLALSAGMGPGGAGRLFWIQRSPGGGQHVLCVLDPHLPPQYIALPPGIIRSATAGDLGGGLGADLLLGLDPLGGLITCTFGSAMGWGPLGADTTSLDLDAAGAGESATRKTLADFDHDGFSDVLALAPRRLRLARGAPLPNVPTSLGVHVPAGFESLGGSFALPMLIAPEYCAIATHAELLVWAWTGLGGGVLPELVDQVVVGLPAEGPCPDPWIVSAASDLWPEQDLYVLELRLLRLEGNGQRTHLAAAVFGYTDDCDLYAALLEAFPGAWTDSNFDCDDATTGAAFVGGIILMPVGVPPFTDDDFPVVPQVQ